MPRWSPRPRRAESAESPSWRCRGPLTAARGRLKVRGIDGSPKLGARTVLVVSAEGERREGWARIVEQTGARALRCVGPTVSCALFGGRDCPLLAEAQVALYDRDVLTPRFLRVLAKQRRRPFVFAGRDQPEPRGGHRPMHITRLMPTDDGLCFGSLGTKVIVRGDL